MWTSALVRARVLAVLAGLSGCLDYEVGGTHDLSPPPPDADTTDASSPDASTVPDASPDAPIDASPPDAQPSDAS